MQVSDIMTRRLVTVAPYDRLALVRTIFDNVAFHHLLVVERRRLVGVLSDRDYLKAISPKIGFEAATDRDLATLDQRVHQVMGRDLVTLGPAAGVAEAVACFLAHRISCLPVVDDERRPLGILSWRDIFGAWHAQQQAVLPASAQAPPTASSTATATASSGSPARTG